MKINIHLLLLAIFSFLFIYGCSENQGSTNGNMNNQLVVDDTQQISGTYNTLSSPDVQTDLQPKIPIPDDEILLQLINSNIDDDKNDEQILILKKRDSQDAVIKIAVIDFDIVRNRYTIPWESDTGAVNIRSFNISLMDIIGDHKLEIVCTGKNADGWQTIDIFRRTRTSGKPVLYYTSILNIAVNGDITIEEKERESGYLSGEKTGQSFPVTTLMNDTDSDNIFDLIKTSYYWKHQDNKYVEVQRKKIPGQEIEDNQLKELFTQNDDALSDFISGPWSKTSNSGNSDSKTNPVIFFEPETERISFYYEDILEIYSWQDSTRILLNKISIKGLNILINYITIRIYIYIQSLENIRITVYDSNSQHGVSKNNTTWSGEYFRIGKEMQNLLAAENTYGNEHTPEKPDLSGYYQSNTGSELFFDFPLFTMKDTDDSYKGGFSVYSINDFILILKITDHSGLVSDTKTFKIDYLETETETEIIRTLYMYPGIVGIYGFKPLSIDFLRFEQIETIEADVIEETE